MIPVIESTMAKIDVYTKSYAFRGEVKKVRITFALIWMKIIGNHLFEMLHLHRL